MRIIPEVVLMASCLFLNACGSAPGGGDDGHDSATGPEMRPGENCKSCHSFSAAGTVFGDPEASASDGKKGATVTLKDAAGKTVTLTSNGAGNFYTSKSLQFPLTAQITLDGVTKTMTEPVTSGACASCHSQPSANGAPGRLYVAP